MHIPIYNKLINIAKNDQIIYYSEIAPLANLDMGNPADRNILAEILGEISTFEHSQGHPLLSAVVVHMEDGMPGQGFFTMAREMGLHAGNDDLSFFSKELQRIYNHW